MGGEHFTRTETPSDAHEVHPRVPRRIGVHIGVADVNRGFARHVQRTQNFVHRVGRGLSPHTFAFTDGYVEKPREIVFRKRLHGKIHLVGNHRCLHPRRAQSGNRFGHPVIGFRLVRAMHRIVFAERFRKLRGLFVRNPFRHRSFQKFAHAVAHKRAHFVLGARGHSDLGKRHIERVRQVVEGVQNGAVHIEHGKAVLHLSSAIPADRPSPVGADRHISFLT